MVVLGFYGHGFLIVAWCKLQLDFNISFTTSKIMRKSNGLKKKKKIHDLVVD